MAKEPDLALKLEEWGTNEEIEDLDYAHKKRSALQQEIARKEQTTRRQHRHQQQLEIILEWRDEESRLKENQRGIQFSSHRIIDMDQPKGTYRASRGDGAQICRSGDIWTGEKGIHFVRDKYRSREARIDLQEYGTMRTQKEEDEWRNEQNRPSQEPSLKH